MIKDGRSQSFRYDDSDLLSCQIRITGMAVLRHGQAIREHFELDIAAVQKELIIASPGLNRERTMYLLDLLPFLYQRNVRIAVYTLAAEQYPEEQQEVVTELIHMMRDQNIWVDALPALHEHFAILDHQTVWYGSANLMSRTKEEDNMIRIIDPEVCGALLESVIQKENA